MTSHPTLGRPLLDGLVPRIVTRERWGAEPALDWPPEHHPVRALVLHHTGADHPDAEVLVRRIQRFHAHDRGWGDIGYSFVIGADGAILEGREGTATSVAPEVVQAAHALGHNPGTIGIAIAGRYDEELPTAAAWASLVALCATLARSCDLDPHGGAVTLPNGRTMPAVITGHRHTCATTCPGDGLTSALSRLRTEVAEELRGGRQGDG